MIYTVRYWDGSPGGKFEATSPLDAARQWAAMSAIDKKNRLGGSKAFQQGTKSGELEVWLDADWDWTLFITDEQWFEYRAKARRGDPDSATIRPINHGQFSAYSTDHGGPIPIWSMISAETVEQAAITFSVRHNCTNVVLTDSTGSRFVVRTVPNFTIGKIERVPCASS